MLKRNLVLKGIAAAIVVLSVGACSNLGMGMGSTQVYKATLSGSSEVPPNDSAGTGTAEVRVNTKTNEATWKVSYSGLSGPATAGHIHGPAVPGQNAGVVVPFPGVQGAMSAEGKTTLTPALMSDLAAGKLYVNVHTAKHPGGEIRGQLGG